MSVKFELDNGELKEYPTWTTDYGTEGCYPEEPYHTKCGLSFKEYPKNGACDHLECAIHASREETIFPVAMYCLFSIMMIAIGWYEKGGLLEGIRDSEGFLIVFGSFFMLMSVFPFKRWLELREYKNHGSIHGRKARRVFFEDQIILRLQMDNGEIKEYETVYCVGCTSREVNFFDYRKLAERCGIKLPKEPCQECSSLNCAIYKAEKRGRRYKLIKPFLAIFIAISFIILVIAEHRIMPLIIFVLSVFAAIVLFNFGQKHKKYLDELNEFKNNGTINGIQARQISEEPQTHQTL